MWLESIIWNALWYHAILPSNVLLIGLSYQIWKQLDSKNKNSACTAELTSFVLRVARKLIMTIELQYYVNLKANFKGCVCYIFASLSCMSKREHFWNREKWFSFHFKSCFCSGDNQILTSEVFKYHDIIKCLSMKHK